MLFFMIANVLSNLNVNNPFLQQEINVTLTCRILFYLLKVHHDQIVANRLMRPRLDSLRTHIRTALKHQKVHKNFYFILKY